MMKVWVSPNCAPASQVDVEAPEPHEQQVHHRWLDMACCQHSPRRRMIDELEMANGKTRVDLVEVQLQRQGGLSA
jgi:hypothetical protein